MSQLSDAELNEMTIFHSIEESEAAAEVKSDQGNVTRTVVFEESSNSDEEHLIHQEGNLFSSNEAIEPVKASKTAIQESGRFAPFSFSNLIAKPCPHLFPLHMATQGQNEKYQ